MNFTRANFQYGILLNDKSASVIYIIWIKLLDITNIFLLDNVKVNIVNYWVQQIVVIALWIFSNRLIAIIHFLTNRTVNKYDLLIWLLLKINFLYLIPLILISHFQNKNKYKNYRRDRSFVIIITHYLFMKPIPDLNFHFVVPFWYFPLCTEITEQWQ